MTQSVKQSLNSVYLTINKMAEGVQDVHVALKSGLVEQATENAERLNNEFRSLLRELGFNIRQVEMAATTEAMKQFPPSITMRKPGRRKAATR